MINPTKFPGSVNIVFPDDLITVIFAVSDFNHQLARIHEQHAEDMAQLVEAFRKKTADIQNEG